MHGQPGARRQPGLAGQVDPARADRSNQPILSTDQVRALFPPLGLATLASYLRPGDDVTIHDEHVEKLRLDDEPDLVVIQVYITSARRSYQIADHYRRRGAYVVLGGLHVTSLPDEAAAHANTMHL